MADIATAIPAAASAHEVRAARLSAFIRYTLLTVVGLIMLYPLIWLIGASFKTNSEIFGSIGFIPREPTLEGYVKGWETSTPYTFGRFFWNTFLIILPKTIFTAISCALVAYGFARFEFPVKRFFFATLIATLLPNVVTRIPQYILFRDLGWLDTYLPLWVPSAFAGDAFFAFMLVQFLRAIPRDMDEAARVDGANSLQTLIHIVVTMLLPALISVMLFPVHVVDERLSRDADLSVLDREVSRQLGAETVDRQDRGFRLEPDAGDVGPGAAARADRVLHGSGILHRRHLCRWGERIIRWSVCKSAISKRPMPMPSRPSTGSTWMSRITSSWCLSAPWAAPGPPRGA